jgi:AP-3 complex subunit delta
LFAFIQADLNSYRPKFENGFGFPDAGPSFESAEPRFPKSLYLIRPLFTSYELNPVALTAQENVPIPEGLDLDAWFVPPPPEPIIQINTDADGGIEKKKTKKGKKGKGREVNGGTSKSSGKKKVKEEGSGVVLAPIEPEVETVEERAEKERVRI